MVRLITAIRIAWTTRVLVFCSMNKVIGRQIRSKSLCDVHT